ncbi:MAG: hypothetical protein HY314_10930 [Acidobacteria bacterium]|nr:hypothetical protein [Acidobacteriota bacterium]
MESVNYVAKLSEGLAVGGIEDTLRVLNEGRVERLIVCASFPPSAGWQCADCSALYTGMDGRPPECLYCNSKRTRMADLKAQMIARAYQLGCAIEITTRCPVLEELGGAGALLSQPHSRAYNQQPGRHWVIEAARAGR